MDFRGLVVTEANVVPDRNGAPEAAADLARGFCTLFESDSEDVEEESTGVGAGADSVEQEEVVDVAEVPMTVVASVCVDEVVSADSAEVSVERIEEDGVSGTNTGARSTFGGSTMLASRAEEDDGNISMTPLLVLESEGGVRSKFGDEEEEVADGLVFNSLEFSASLESSGEASGSSRAEGLGICTDAFLLDLLLVAERKELTPAIMRFLVIEKNGDCLDVEEEIAEVANIP